MSKSTRTLILESVVANLQKIRAGSSVPTLPLGSSERFNTTVRLVTRHMREFEVDDLPAILVTAPETRKRHILSDVTFNVMDLYLTGVVLSNESSSLALDGLMDDMQHVLMGNPKWDGNAIATRTTQALADEAAEELEAMCSFVCQVDYLEYPSATGEGYIYHPLDEDASLTWQQRVMNVFQNTLAKTGGDLVKVVQRADVWPIPPERISMRQLPGIWLKDLNETYQYSASMQATHRVSVDVLLLVFEPDSTKFSETIDIWAANIKSVLGEYADLNDLVNTVDINSIRTVGSEYPLVKIETNVTIRYMDDFTNP